MGVSARRGRGCIRFRICTSYGHFEGLSIESGLGGDRHLADRIGISVTTGGEGRAATCQNAEAFKTGGGGGIRTHGSFRFGGFQDRRANRFGGPRFRATA